MNGIVPWGRASTYPYPTLAPLAPYRAPNPGPPPPDASPSLKAWWQQISGEPAEEKKVTATQSAVVGLRQNGEGAVIGALLALIDTELGGLDLGGRVPLDWVGAAVFYALSIRDAGNPEGLASDYRAMGQSCTSIAMYRTIHKWRDAAKNIPRNNAITGDPVLAAGKSSAF